MSFEELIGNCVVGVSLSSDRTVLQFEVMFGKSLTWLAEGDCCSSSWFEHLTGVDVFSNGGAYVTEVREKLLPDPEYDDSYECLKNYGWTIVTDRGYFDIEMRNSSNGYYGGWAEFIMEPWSSLVTDQLTKDI